MADAVMDIVEVDAAILPLVQHLRYRVYVREMGFALEGADTRSRRLVQPTDALGRSFALFRDDILAASCQLIFIDGPDDLAPFTGWGIDTHLPDFAGQAVIVSKLVSDPRERGREVLNALLGRLFETIIAERRRYAVILAEAHLKAFYTALGFVSRASGVNVPPYGAVDFMVFDMADPRHAEGKTLAGWVFKSAFAALMPSETAPQS
jgi:predicted GNAT family N-acyltransferase